jgi:hypothetical protein
LVIVGFAVGATVGGTGVGGVGVVTVTLACERTGSSERATTSETADTTATPAKIAVTRSSHPMPKLPAPSCVRFEAEI